MEQWIEDNLIFKGISGSRAYGTSTPESDYDYRGVTVPPKEYVLGMRRFDQFHTVKDDDVTIYALSRFFGLLLDSNPNILELIFLPENCIIKTSPAHVELVKNRAIFLSTRAVFTFSGYAHAQFKKMKAHKDRLENPPSKPERRDFAVVVEDLAAEFLPPPKRGIIRITGTNLWYDRARYKQAKDVYNKYRDWRKTATAAKDFDSRLNYDTKNAMHLIRLLNSGKSLISTGVFEVKSPISDLLLDIRHGKYSYAQVLEIYGDYKSEFEAAVETSPLPKLPDEDAANKLCVKLTEGILYPAT